MNPNRGESQANFEMPPQPPAPEQDGQRQEQSAEAPAAAPERAAQRPAQPALPAIPDDIPAADQPVIAAPPDDTAAAPAVHSPAADTDHIEREWVDKAKAVIAKTQDDPYTQKTEMSKIKADYIQKRFNKTIKTDEAPA